MNYIADMNTPLAMMVAGFSVAQADLGKMLRNLRIYYISFLKLILFPLFTIGILKIMALPADVYTTVLIGASCPAAATGTMMAIRYKQNYTYIHQKYSPSLPPLQCSRSRQLSSCQNLCYNVPRRQHAVRNTT